MSELPVEAAIVGLAWRVLRTARPGSAEARERAEAVAGDQGDETVRTVYRAAYRTRRDVDRIEGFLRFKPNRDGIHIARCAPDTFVLPALARHFTARFGAIPWAIIDEKRGLCLSRIHGAEARLLTLDPATATQSAAPDQWETLWQTYHRAINNESRSNPALQRQFIPLRYWKYLVEEKG
jgi:probable DNA metabolism protein